MTSSGVAAALSGAPADHFSKRTPRPFKKSRISNLFKGSGAYTTSDAGIFDVLPSPVVARDLEALIANAREQATLAAGAGNPAVFAA